MKIKIQLKDPDGVYDAITDAVKDQLDKIEGITDDERETMQESRREGMNELLSKWIEYSEYITIEFDTEAGTAVVCPLS